jgi:hypothetical protein
MSQASEKISVEEMWRALEEFGIRRDMLERLHPTPETLSHLYSSIKKQKIEASKYQYLRC